jgi:cyanophycinase
MSPARISEDQNRGWIVPVGGAEEKVSDPRILRRFLSLCGSEDAAIAIIPTASTLDDTGARYEEIFKELGAARATSLPFNHRRDAERDDYADVLDEATGVFFTGGNQLRISTILGGTQVATQIRRMNARGIAVGGTSAGAAILPEHMIAYGSVGSTPMAGMVSLAPGLGLTNRFMIDQHFRERDRLGRLLSGLSYNPFAVGLGLDEDTSAFISPDNVVRVVGSGAVTVVDVSNLGHSSVAEACEGEPLCMTDVRIHILPHGSRFNLETREAIPPTE